MPDYVSLFSGAGGLDLGLETAGWSCLYAGDLDSAAVETMSRNRGRRIGRARFLSDAVVEQADLRALNGPSILSCIGRRKGDLPLLAGGPPCQSWSSAGHQLGFADPRGRLFDDYLRLARQLDVRWLLFENVRGLVTARGNDGVPGSALGAIRHALKRAGWETRVDLLNAADFGVPQRRVRLLLIGYRAGDPPALPARTHCDGSSTPWVSLGECLSRLAPPSADEVIRPTGKMAADLSCIPSGSGVKSAGKREATRPGGHWGYKQGAFVADLSKPARTVTASSQQDWVIDPVLGLRRLSPRECAAIQTFPKDWTFSGPRSDQYRQIGNAVPPRLAHHLGRALLSHISKCEDMSRAPVASPLPPRLQAAIDYTLREELRNGFSRRIAPSRRRVRVGAG